MTRMIFKRQVQVLPMFLTIVFYFLSGEFPNTVYFEPRNGLAVWTNADILISGKVKLQGQSMH